MSRTGKQLEDHLLAFLRKEADPAIRPGLIVAVSGGLDSTALLHLAVATRDRHGRPVFAVHVNHAVRPDADREEARLRDLCSRLGVRFRAVRVDLDPAAAFPPGEATLRRARYRLIHRVAREVEPRSWILLAHQQEDQAETVLFNLTRGTGLAGLSGIGRRRGILLRPLLDVSRSTLRSYLEEIGARWTEDPMNRDLRYARNRIRHRILPAIETELRPRAAAAIARAARAAGKARETMEALGAECLAGCALPAPSGEVRLDARRLRSYHEGLIEQALRQAVRTVRGSTLDIPSSLWRDLMALHARAGDGRFRIAPDTSVELTARMVRINPIGEEGDDPPAALLPRSGRIRFLQDGRVETLQLRPALRFARIRVRGLGRLQIFDADAVRRPARIRLAREGDRIAIGESTGSRKLSDLLAERGVPRSLRSLQPVIEDTEGILWVPGIRRAPRALVRDETERIWTVRWIGRLPADGGMLGGETRR